MPYRRTKIRLNAILGLILLAGFGAIVLLGHHSSRTLLERDSTDTAVLDLREDSDPAASDPTAEKHAVQVVRRNLYCQIALGVLVTALVIAINLGGIRRFQAHMEERASTDDLTGMPNRRAFLRQALRDVAQAGRYKTPISFLMIDVDHFRQINDQWGPETGDLVLKSLADRIQMTIREDDLAGRMDGEEFGVILPRTDLEAACIAAERLRLAAESAPLGGISPDLALTVAIGVATRQNAYTDLNELMRMATLALYEAKNKGGNRVCTMHDRA